LTPSTFELLLSIDTRAAEEQAQTKGAFPTPTVELTRSIVLAPRPSKPNLYRFDSRAYDDGRGEDGYLVRAAVPRRVGPQGRTPGASAAGASAP
jgi:hypothetical protein